MSLTPEQLQAISMQQQQNAQLPGQQPPGVESPELMASRSAASNPNFLRFLIEIMRQGSMNPNPPGFDMNTQGAAGGGVQPASMLEGLARRRGMLQQ